jgi:hypothetical protein
MVVQGYVAARLSRSIVFPCLYNVLSFLVQFFFLVYMMLNQCLFLNSIKQLVGDLLSAILNSLRITGFTPAVILLKGVALSLSLSLSLSTRSLKKELNCHIVRFYVRKIGECFKIDSVIILLGIYFLLVICSCFSLIFGFYLCFFWISK